MPLWLIFNATTKDINKLVRDIKLISKNKTKKKPLLKYKTSVSRNFICHQKKTHYFYIKLIKKNARMETGCKKLLIILNLVRISRYTEHDIKERVSIFFFFFFFLSFETEIFSIYKSTNASVKLIHARTCCPISNDVRL